MMPRKAPAAAAAAAAATAEAEAAAAKGKAAVGTPKKRAREDAAGGPSSADPSVAGPSSAGEETGAPRAVADTPALILDLDAMDRNIDKMKRALAKVNASTEKDVKLRLHGKTCKSAEAALYIQERTAEVFAGVCCQTVAEAVAMVRGGVKDVLITNEVATPAKLRRCVGGGRSLPCSLARRRRRCVECMLCVLPRRRFRSG